MTDDRADPYTVLGVPSTASQREITQAFHRLLRRYHPDTRPATSHADDLRQLIAAYTVLRDPVRRTDYDLAHPETPPQPQTPQPQPPRPVRRQWTTAQPDIRVGPVRRVVD
jgi:curved DNA-binding protein CbpA